MEDAMFFTTQCVDIIKKYPDPKAIPLQQRQETYDIFVACIKYHNELYYKKNQPIISDFEYDQLFAYLKKLENTFPQLISPHSPTQTTQRIDDKITKDQYIQDKNITYDKVHTIEKKVNHFPPAFHKIPLLSLENTYDANDIYEWYTKLCNILEKKDVDTKNLFFSIEPKFDGVSVELIYEWGKLIQASTRWDGYVGDDITQNVCMINNIKEISYDKRLHLRGEILLSKKEFEKLNHERKSQWLPIFANTRNAAAGSIKLLDPFEVKKRNLTVVVYDILLWWPSELENSWSSVIFQWFHTVWLPYIPVFVQDNCTIEDIVNICTNQTTKQKVHSMTPDFDFDGLVIKLTWYRFRELVGSTNHHPRWAMAFKFPAQQIATQIISVDWQVWRTGIITPVANVTPVNLGGVRIKRVSLHNMDFIQSKDIYIGDWVWIQRSGEVIPHVLGVIEARRQNKEKKQPDFIQETSTIFLQKEESFLNSNLFPIIPPTHCPVCKSQVLFDETFYICTNPDCPAQLKQRLIHFVSRQCMDIEWLGKSIITILIDQGIVKKIADIYKLLDPYVQTILKRYPWFGDKKIQQLTDSLNRSKHIQCWRLLHALWLPQIGKKNAQNIQKAIKEWIENSKQEENSKQDIRGELFDTKNKNTVSACFFLPKKPSDLLPFLTNELFLTSIYGIGKETVTASILFCKQHKHIFDDLTFCWIEIVRDDIRMVKTDTVDKNFEKKQPSEIYKSFSITWTFPIPRQKLIEIFVQYWYVFDDIPKKTTSFLLVGENPGNKLQKAQELAILTYIGRDEICRQFPFLVLQKDNIQWNTVSKPIQESLF